MAQPESTNPPAIDGSTEAFPVTTLIDFALSHGLTVRPQTYSEGNHLASHIPVTLFPTPFPHKNWEHAVRIQKLYNLLYARVADDVEWLGGVISEYILWRVCPDNRLSEVDEFISRLWELYKTCQYEGIVQVSLLLIED